MIISCRQLIEYLEGLTITQGVGAGERIRLFPWQKKFVRGASARTRTRLSVLREGRVRRPLWPG